MDGVARPGHGVAEAKGEHVAVNLDGSLGVRESYADDQVVEPAVWRAVHMRLVLHLGSRIVGRVGPAEEHMRRLPFAVTEDELDSLAEGKHFRKEPGVRHSCPSPGLLLEADSTDL